MMKSNLYVQDPQTRPLCPKVSEDTEEYEEGPSRFRRKKQFDGDTTTKYNENFQSMPKRF